MDWKEVVSTSYLTNLLQRGSPTHIKAERGRDGGIDCSAPKYLATLQPQQSVLLFPVRTQRGPSAVRGSSYHPNTEHYKNRNRPQKHPIIIHCYKHISKQSPTLHILPRKNEAKTMSLNRKQNLHHQIHLSMIIIPMIMMMMAPTFSIIGWQPL